MSLKDLLPPGTYDEIKQEAHDTSTSATPSSQQAHGNGHGNGNGQGNGQGPLLVSCPYCHKQIVYSTDNPFRPFCSERCKMLDLGAWANEERTVAGNDINIDEDADLLSDPNLPVRNLPSHD